MKIITERNGLRRPPKLVNLLRPTNVSPGMVLKTTSGTIRNDIITDKAYIRTFRLFFIFILAPAGDHDQSLSNNITTRHM